VVPGDGLAAVVEPLELVSQPVRRRLVIVIPVRDDTARGPVAPEVALRADLDRGFEMDESDSGIIRNQVSDVLSVGQYQQLRASVRLRLKTRNRPR
jgi:hypothetical protein